MILLLSDFIFQKDKNLIKDHISQEVKKLLYFPYFQENLDTLE